MSPVRLALTVAGGNAIGGDAFAAGGVDASFSGAGDAIGLSPLNAATLTPAGYVDAASQYALDQLTFAVSQGEYTALGATPQTYVQNMLGSASPVLQLSMMNQNLYNPVSIQTNLFATNAQMMGGYGSANPFVGPYAGVGPYVGGSFYGPSIPFSSIATVNELPAISGIGQGLDGSAATLTPGSIDLGTGTGVPTAGTVAPSIGTGTIVNGVPTLVGQIASGANQTGSEFAAGSAGSPASSSGTPTTNPGAVAASAGSSGNHDQVVPHQDASPAAGANPAAFLTESLAVRTTAADPFAHYTSLGQGIQSSQALVVVDHAVTIGHDGAGAAAMTGGDSFAFSPQLFSVYDSHMGQAAEIHLDPVGHALQHVASAGGHLV